MASISYFFTNHKNEKPLLKFTQKNTKIFQLKNYHKRYIFLQYQNLFYSKFILKLISQYLYLNAFNLHVFSLQLTVVIS